MQDINKSESEKNWYVYIVRCADGSLYTGITTNVKRRITEHNHSRLGAKYTRMRRPVLLVYQETHCSRSAVCKRESHIKMLKKNQKEMLVDEFISR